MTGSRWDSARSGCVEAEFSPARGGPTRAVAALGRRLRRLGWRRGRVPSWELVPRAWQLLQEELAPECPGPLIALAALAASCYGLRQQARRWQTWCYSEDALPLAPQLAAPGGREETSPAGPLVPGAEKLARLACRTWRAYLQTDPACWEQADRWIDQVRRELARPRFWRRGDRSGQLARLEVLCWFVLAARGEVQRWFQRVGPMVPPALRTGDPRLHLVLEACRRACHRAGNDAIAVLDAGCGPGRYLNHLRRHFPRAELVGVDPLAREGTSPAGVRFYRGDLLRLPFAAGQFDLVLCIEALEHALLPQQACRELLRVARPGGVVLVVDKHAAARPSADCPPWEQWFEPGRLLDELCQTGGRGTCGPVRFGDRRERVYSFWQVELPAASETSTEPVLAAVES